MALTILHAADLHLGGPVAARLPQARQAAARAREDALERLVELSRKAGARLVLLAGDVFDSPRPPLGAVLALERALAAWRAMGADVFIAPGNHDHLAAGSVWREWSAPDGVTVFSEAAGVALADLGLWVAGAGHGARHVAEDLAAGLPAPPQGLMGLALVHADPEGNPAGPVGGPYAPTRLASLIAQPFAYWALGHWHAPVELAPGVVMAGAPQGAHWDESGPHGAWLVETEPGAGTARAVFHALAPLTFHDEVMDDLADVDSPGALAARVGRGLGELDPESRHLLRLTLAGPSPLWQGLRDPEQADDLARGLARELGVMGVDLRAGAVTPPLDLAALTARDDVLGGLLRGLAALEADPAALADMAETLAPELHPLARRMEPGERRAWLAGLIGQARALAVADLWQGGDQGQGSDRGEGGE